MNSYFPPYVGGIETYVSNVAKALHDRGHRVTVFCSSRGSVPGTTLEGGAEIVRFGTPLNLYGAPLGVFPSRFFSGSFDIVHSNFPNPYFAAVSSWVARARGIPAILTWHNDLPAVRPAAALLVHAHDNLATSYLNYYKTIIATTSIYAHRSKILRRFSEKVKVVRNGVDTVRFTPNLGGRSVRERYGLADDFVVLFVGALTTWHSYKGLDVLIEAFAKLSRRLTDARLLVVGGGNLLPFYRSLAAELGVGDRVDFAGHVSDSDLPAFYSACDVFVLASKDSSEGFGLVLLEAMACGRPVVASAVGGIPELIHNGENGVLVEANDSEALAATLETLHASDELRDLMGRAGRSFAELHDWRLVASNLESIYLEQV